jgi:hypothetical protein
MRILTVGDSWTYGLGSSDPATKAWPAVIAQQHNVDVVNLARPGSSNQRAMRVAIEELCRDPAYDYVIFPLCPAERNEILNVGKWQQLWPSNPLTPVEKIYASLWHPWNDVQQIIMLSFWFAHAIKAMDIPLYITGLSLCPNDWILPGLKWVNNYRDDNDFASIGMPVNTDLSNISTVDLDRKLKSLRAIHNKNLSLQPDYMYDVVNDYYQLEKTQKTYNYTCENSHPNDAGNIALADYFAKKIGLTK